MTIEELEKELLKLSDAEKLVVLKRLIAGLEESSDREVARAWLDEAHHRYQELKDGMAQPIPAESVITNARDRLRNAR